MGFLDEDIRGPVTIIFLRAPDLHEACPAIRGAIEHRKKGEIGEFYPLFVLDPQIEGGAGSDLIYRAWKLGLNLQEETGWGLRVEFRRGKSDVELETYSRELQAVRVYAARPEDGDASVLSRVESICQKKGLRLLLFRLAGTGEVDFEDLGAVAAAEEEGAKTPARKGAKGSSSPAKTKSASTNSSTNSSKQPGPGPGPGPGPEPETTTKDKKTSSTKKKPRSGRAAS